MSGPVGTFLLDTCALLDLSINPDLVAPQVMTTVTESSTRLLVSAASAWEVAIKVRQGRLPGGERLVEAWDQNLVDIQADSLTIDALDALNAGGLNWSHRDPFDRMIVAQALRRNVAILTSDRVLLAAPMVTTIDSRG